jgi:hypothetical protein
MGVRSGHMNEMFSIQRATTSVYELYVQTKVYVELNNIDFSDT